MKNFRLLIIALLGVISITSCMKNDSFDDGFDYAKEKARYDSTMNKQKPILAAYAAEHYSDNRYYNDSVGMYLDILTPATDESYEYVLQGSSFISPQIQVKYKGKLLLTGEVFEDATGTAQQFYLNPNSNINVTQAWIRAFLPRNVTINGTDILYGLVPKGIKKGTKFKFIAPSPIVYDNRERKDNTGKVIVPKDSPVEYEVEVIDIKNI